MPFCAGCPIVAALYAIGLDGSPESPYNPSWRYAETPGRLSRGWRNKGANIHVPPLYHKWDSVSSVFSPGAERRAFSAARRPQDPRAPHPRGAEPPRRAGRAPAQPKGRSGPRPKGQQNKNILLRSIARTAGSAPRRAAAKRRARRKRKRNKITCFDAFRPGVPPGDRVSGPGGNGAGTQGRGGCPVGGAVAGPQAKRRTPGLGRAGRAEDLPPQGRAAAERRARPRTGARGPSSLRGAEPDKAAPAGGGCRAAERLPGGRPSGQAERRPYSIYGRYFVSSAFEA